MEEKQLDFNQPFLSVRRFSPKVASETERKNKTIRKNSSIRSLPFPSYKSELKSGPISHPGNVPFIWEHTPGRPKNEGQKLQTLLGIKQPPITPPNLPPGRVTKDSDQVSKGTGSISKSATKKKILKEMMQENDSSNSDDDEDEAYQDALDTLSTSESYFMNCSASGLSVKDDQEETQSFGSFSSDQHARDFMIGRFLPAAKAMASVSPPYASRKALVRQEEPGHVEEVVVVRRQRYSPIRQIILSQYAQDIGEGEGEDEDDTESDGCENIATKVCGLFPRLCFLNPFPELRMEGRVLSSAAYGIQAKSSTTYNGTGKEHARSSHREKKSVYSQFGFREEKVKNETDPQRGGSKKLSAFESNQSDYGCACPVVEKTLYIDSVHEVESSSNSSSSAMKGQDNHSWDPLETTIKDRRSSGPLLDLPFTCCPDKSNNDTQTHITCHSNKIELTKPLEQEIDLDKDLVISIPKVAQWKKTLLDNSVISNQEAINLRLPLSLPSPKAPTESWLKKTLPTISSSHVTAKILVLGRTANNNATTHDPKWERIVKSSEEPLTTISED